MDNSENKINLVSELSIDPRVGISWSAPETDDRFYLSELDTNATEYHFLLLLIKSCYKNSFLSWRKDSKSTASTHLKSTNQGIICHWQIINTLETNVSHFPNLCSTLNAYGYSYMLFFRSLWDGNGGWGRNKAAWKTTYKLQRKVYEN